MTTILIRFGVIARWLVAAGALLGGISPSGAIELLVADSGRNASWSPRLRAGDGFAVNGADGKPLGGVFNVAAAGQLLLPMPGDLELSRMTVSQEDVMTRGLEALLRDRLHLAAVNQEPAIEVRLVQNTPGAQGEPVETRPENINTDRFARIAYTAIARVALELGDREVPVRITAALADSGVTAFARAASSWRPVAGLFRRVDFVQGRATLAESRTAVAALSARRVRVFFDSSLYPAPREGIRPVDTLAVLLREAPELAVFRVAGESDSGRAAAKASAAEQEPAWMELLTGLSPVAFHRLVRSDAVSAAVGRRASPAPARQQDSKFSSAQPALHDRQDDRTATLPAGIESRPLKTYRPFDFRDPVRGWDPEAPDAGGADVLASRGVVDLSVAPQSREIAPSPNHPSSRDRTRVDVAFRAGPAVVFRADNNVDHVARVVRGLDHSTNARYAEVRGSGYAKEALAEKLGAAGWTVKLRSAEHAADRDSQINRIRQFYPGRALDEKGKVIGTSADVQKMIGEINHHIDYYRKTHFSGRDTLTGDALVKARRYGFETWAKQHRGDPFGKGALFSDTMNKQVDSNLGKIDLDWLATFGANQWAANLVGYFAGKEFWFAKRTAAPDLRSFGTAYPKTDFVSLGGAELLASGRVSVEEAFNAGKQSAPVLAAKEKWDGYYERNKDLPYRGLGHWTKGPGASMPAGQTSTASAAPRMRAPGVVAPVQAAGGMTIAGRAPTGVLSGAERVSGRSFAQPNVKGVLLQDAAVVDGAPVQADELGLVFQGSGEVIDFVRLRRFATALWATYVGVEGPGISIDPMGKGVTTHQVRYIGAVRNTDLGRVMRETDYLMKRWAIGTHRPDLPNFLNPDDWTERNGGKMEARASRFWLVPQELTFKRAAGMLTLAAGRMTVQTEYLDGSVVGAKNAENERFARWFTDHYEQIAARYPIFQELFDYAQLVSLGTYLKEQKIPLLWFLLRNRELILTERAIDDVPALRSKSEHKWFVSIHGGVELDAVAAVRSSKGVADDAELANVLVAARSAAGGGTDRNKPLAFTAGGANYVVPGAGALSPASTRAMGDILHTDYSHFDEHPEDSGEEARKRVTPGLELIRYYDPSCATAGQFGPGWHLAVPFHLTAANSVALRAGRPPEHLEVHNRLSGEVETLARAPVGNERGERYEYAPADRRGLVVSAMPANGGWVVRDRLGVSLEFDAAGLLTRLSLRAASKTGVRVAGKSLLRIVPEYAVVYAYETSAHGAGKRLARIEQGSTNAEIQWDDSGVAPRIGRLQVTRAGREAETLTYRYGPDGRLAAVETRGGTTNVSYHDSGMRVSVQR